MAVVEKQKKINVKRTVLFSNIVFEKCPHYFIINFLNKRPLKTFNEKLHKSSFHKIIFSFLLFHLFLPLNTLFYILYFSIIFINVLYSSFSFRFLLFFILLSIPFRFCLGERVILKFLQL